MWTGNNAMRLAAALFAVILFSGCATGTIVPFRGGDELQPESEGEQRLWYSAKKIQAVLERSGQTYEDEALESYLQQVMDRLYPDFGGRIKVHVLKAPVLNAFALPNGHVYVNTGLLAAMENEEQMATVLAHEGVHFMLKHSALQRKNYHNSMGFRWATALLGIPFLPDLIAASSIFGYSQQHENEADTYGHERLLAAGYDVREAPKSFMHLALEAKANKAPEPFFFSTHPKLKNRIRHFEELNQSVTAKGGEVGAAAYQNHVAGLRPMVLKEKVSRGKYDAVIAVLTKPELAPMYGHERHFYLAEAYRLRNEESDPQKAIRSYATARRMVPDYAPTYKSLGMLYLKAKRLPEAADCFERYLRLNPRGKDRAFIEAYLKQSRQDEATP